VRRFYPEDLSAEEAAASYPDQTDDATGCCSSGSTY
jgi:hypothetical protein